ncbi:MAG: hydrogenase 3 maturation endopeptidase HyCI [Caldimicrobium sp.]
MSIDEFLKNLKGKIVIAGIGNPLRGDDAVGSFIAKSIKDKVDAIVIDCEDTPERYLGKIIEHNPNTVVFIDALDMNLEAGSVIFFEGKALEGMKFSTHTTSLNLYTNFLNKNLHVPVFILGIQPESSTLGKPLSKRVLETAEILIKLLRIHLNAK